MSTVVERRKLALRGDLVVNVGRRIRVCGIEFRLQIEISRLAGARLAKIGHQDQPIFRVALMRP